MAEQQSASGLQNTDYNTMDVDSFFKKVVIKEGEKYTIPDEVKEELSPDRFELFNAEARRRTTEVTFAKEKKARIALEARLKAQEQFLKPVGLPAETEERLETLKYEDPDKWLLEVTALKKEAEEKHKEEFNTAYETAYAQLSAKERETVINQKLNEFNNANSDRALSDENLKYDVPPRLKERLENGDINEFEFLNTVATIVHGATAPVQKHVTAQPRIGNIPDAGGESDNSKKQSLEDLYRQV